VDSLLKLGIAQARSRDLAGADKTFAEVLRLSPQNPQALNGIGLVRFQQKRVSDAAQCFNAALKQRADFAPAVLNLAIVTHQNPQEHATALRMYKQYVALKPPGNIDEVNLLIRQLEQELTPPRPQPAALAPTTPVMQVTQATPTTVPNPSPRQTATVSNRMTTPIVKTEPVSPPKPLVASNPAPKTVAVAAAPPPAPIPPREKVPLKVLQSEPQIKVAQDVPSPRSELVAPPQVVASTVGGANSDAPAAGRYKYLAPAKQPAGNRSAAEKFFRNGAQAQQEHRLADAMASYSKATQLDPAYFEAYYNLALAASEMGNTQASLAAYERALVIQPDSQDARYSFALALKQANYLTDAANELEKLLAKYPNDGRAHLALGNLYAQNFDEPNKARQHYVKALDTDPQSPQAGAVRYWLAAHPQ
jgi:tetratricopeptide (TPR) repeat protein